MLLYNCETWTLTKRNWKKFSIFSKQQLLRRILNITLKDNIKNEEIYKRSQKTLATTEIRKRRLNWPLHMLRLPERTPAKLDFKEHLRKKITEKTKTNVDQTNKKRSGSQ